MTAPEPGVRGTGRRPARRRTPGPRIGAGAGVGCGRLAERVWVWELRRRGGRGDGRLGRRALFGAGLLRRLSWRRLSWPTSSVPLSWPISWRISWRTSWRISWPSSPTSWRTSSRISSRISSSPSPAFSWLSCLLAFLALLPFSHRDPPVAADPCLSGVSSRPLPHGANRFSSILAGDRLSPNREAQSCAPQELTYRRQSEPCIQYCPQQSCPASPSQYWRPFDRAICSQCQAGECCRSPPNRNTNDSRAHLSPRIRSWKAILSELA